MRSVYIFFALCLLSTYANAQRVKRVISVGPATLHFNLSPGQTEKQKITIHNKLNKPYSFNLDFNDWTLDTTGEIVFFPPGAEPSSCAKWITLDKTFVEVPANGKEEVTVTIRVPDSADAGRESKWTMLNVSTIAEKKAPIKTGNVSYNQNKTLTVGVKIYQTPKSTENATKEIRMRKFYALPDTSNRKHRIECLNAGSILLRCNFSMELASQETGEKITVGPTEALILPGIVRFVDLDIPNTVGKGKYTAIALVDAKDDDIPLEAAEAEIEIK